MTMHLSRLAFTNGQAIPAIHRWDGRNGSPPLQRTGTLFGAKSLALICDDPDAPGGWVRWVLYNLPANLLPERLVVTETLADGAQQRISDFGESMALVQPNPPLLERCWDFQNGRWFATHVGTVS
jgi:phosphatidylethanolamine-binding protein (PEBP) family uncharacterized protein